MIAGPGGLDGWGVGTMNVIRLRWVVGLVVLMAAVPAAGADSPEDLLKARGLKRVGSTYILGSEGDIQKKTAELRALYNQLGAAARQHAETEQQVEGQKEMMRELLRQRVVLIQQITAFDQQIQNFGRTPDLLSRRNEVVNAYNGILDQINLLRSGEGSDAKVQDRLQSEVSRRREGFMQSVLDLRQLVDQVAKSYAELANDAAVKEAVDTLGRTSKSKPKLGPSTQFTANVKLLERIEKSVITDSVDLRKQGGVFWVDATFNGKVVKPMVFDTGAGITTIPARLAEEIGLKPSPSDPVVQCETADGTVVEARRMTIPSLRVGRFLVNSVDCAVMPATKGDVAPLLGQSFHRYFTYKFTPESGHLIMSRIETPESQATAKPARPARGAAKAKSRAGRSRSTGKSAAAQGPDGNLPD
jgi:aspartyl protease family protein